MVETAVRESRLARWVLLAVALVALLGLSSEARAETYDCYWASPGCARSGISPGDYRVSPIYSSYTAKPFMNNPSSGYVKRIDLYNCFSSCVSLGNYGGTGANLVVPITTLGYGPYRRYVCVNQSGSVLGANCGKFNPGDV